MPITPLDPIQIPAKTLDKYWVREIIISAPIPNAEARAMIQLLPYNDSGDVSEENVKNLNITSIMQKAMSNPDSNIAKAMYFLLQAIDDEYTAQTQENT